MSDKISFITNNPGAGPKIGNKDAGIKIVLFEDYNCGFCKKQSKEISSLLKKNSDIEVTVKEFPIFGDDSKKAAVLALAAYDDSDDTYKAFHEILMMNRSYNNEKFLIKAAKKAGIKNINFDDLYNRYDEHLAANYKLATELKLSGTPAIIIGGKIYRGFQNAQQLEAIIDSLENEKSKNSSKSV